MLKSHKDLGRWYSPLEPDGEQSAGAESSVEEGSASGVDLDARHPDLSALGTRLPAEEPAPAAQVWNAVVPESRWWRLARWWR